MNLPVLVNHDPTQVVGKVSIAERSIRIEFVPDAQITWKMLVDAFGNLGMRIHRTHTSAVGEEYILEAEVLEWSVTR